jgi:SAM-dependent methyltransferase
MNIQTIKDTFPDIELEGLFETFPRIPMSDYPDLTEYSWGECHQGFMGAGGLFLVSEMSQDLGLKPGMRVLDLCCGHGASSIYLARHFEVDVSAVDLNIDSAENQKRVDQAGLAGRVTFFKMDARQLRFPQEHFDAIFCLNSYFYFGTDEAYLPYLARFLRPGGRIGITSPCYADGLTPDTPKEFLYDAPDFIESYNVHSPDWWRDHFGKTGLVELLNCEAHPKGREFWLDDVRWLLESTHPKDMDPAMREMALQQIIMLMTDQERFVTYLTLLAEKKI